MKRLEYRESCRSRRSNSTGAAGQALLASFVQPEEEQFVLDYWTADVASEPALVESGIGKRVVRARIASNTRYPRMCLSRSPGLDRTKPIF